jgi:hypothetical protein
MKGIALGLWLLVFGLSPLNLVSRGQYHHAVAGGCGALESSL